MTSLKPELALQTIGFHPLPVEPRQQLPLVFRVGVIATLLVAISGTLGRLCVVALWLFLGWCA